MKKQIVIGALVGFISAALMGTFFPDAPNKFPVQLGLFIGCIVVGYIIGLQKQDNDTGQKV